MATNERLPIVTCRACADNGACREHRAHLVKCGRCAGTGMFITRVENGVPTGPGGICFRCGGKGYTNGSDRGRNNAYDRYAVSKAF